MKPEEIKGLWLGTLGVVIFALTLPMTRLAVGTLEDPQMSGLFIALGPRAGSRSALRRIPCGHARPMATA